MRIFVVGGTESPAHESTADERRKLSEVGRSIGRSLVSGLSDEDEVLLSSPYEGSIDLEVARGMAAAGWRGVPSVVFTYPGREEIRREVRHLKDSLGVDVSDTPIDVPSGSTGDNDDYLWLHCHLVSLELSDAVIAVGGRPDGSAYLILAIAERQGKIIVPAKFLGGASEEFFDRKRFSFDSRLDLEPLRDHTRAGELVLLVDQLGKPDKKNALIFLSYSRARAESADQVEAVLRREHWLTLFRDEEDLRLGSNLTAEVRNYIARADVFVALYCKEYATSPHCFDELEEALDRRRSGDKPELWIIRLDDTRIVPRRAREGSELNPVTKSVNGREDLLACLESQLRSYRDSE